MSDYGVCEGCGCKHLVWETSCPYCRRIKELDAELDIASNEIHRLEAEVAALREGITKIREGDYPQASIHEMCKHYRYGHEGCESCINDALFALLAQQEDV